MRRLLVVPLLIATLFSSMVVAGLEAPAALAAGSTATTGASSTATSSGTITGASSGSDALPNPSLNLSNAEQNAAAGNTTPAAPVTTSTSSGGISGGDAVLIAVIAVLVLSGIAFFVWRDSRRHAAQIGHGHEEPMYGARAHSGSKTPHKPRKLKPAERKRRKRGKAR
jgi:hypothetical protein